MSVLANEIDNSTASRDLSSSSSVGCDKPLAFFCHTAQCCARTQINVALIIACCAALTVFALVLVVYCWLLIVPARRDKCRQRKQKAVHFDEAAAPEPDPDEELREKNVEETVYLRRMSAIHKYPVPPDEK